MADSTLFELSKNCEIHPDKNIVQFCCQHDKVICDSCLPVSHQNCKSIISIEKAAKGVKVGAAISDLERRLFNLCQVTENIQSQREKTLVDLEENRNKFKKRVSELKQNIIAHLDRLEIEIHKDIDYNYKNCTESVFRSKIKLKSSSDLLSTWKSDLESLKQHSSEIQLFKVLKCLDAKTYQKELEIRENQPATVPILIYSPLESESNIQKLVPDLGTITVEDVQVPMHVLDIDQQGQFLIRDERKLSLTHSFQTRQLGNGLGIDRGCFIPDDKLLLCQSVAKQLIVCKLDGSNSTVINLDYKPFNICLYDKKYAVVSLGKKGIQIIDLTSLKPGRRIKVKGFCSGITSVKDKIWQRNKHHTLTIVDIDGKVLKVIKTTIFDPDQICANQDGDVYCTDTTSDKVYVVTSDGKEREIYSSPDLETAIGIAVDDRGDVFVSGGVSNNIHRISIEGQTRDIVLTSDDGIDEPTSLSYNNETKDLLVIHHYYQFINIYKHNKP